MVFMQYEIRKHLKKIIILYSECACFSLWKSSHNGIVIHGPACWLLGTDSLPLCVCTALNTSRLGVIFTSFNTFRLVLKERSEMCQRDGRLGVWCEMGDGVHWAVSHKQCVTSQFYDTFKKCWLAKLSFKLTNIICVIRGTIQTGSKDNVSLSIDFNASPFLNKVPWRKGRDFASLCVFTLCPTRLVGAPAPPPPPPCEPTVLWLVSSPALFWWVHHRYRTSVIMCYNGVC